MSKTIGLTDGGGSSASDVVGAPGGAGAAGTIIVGSAAIRPIGISPSIDTVPGEEWFRGNQWPPQNAEPPVGPAPPWKQNANRHFTPVTFPPGAGTRPVVTMPPRGWDPAYYQLVLLTEFARAWVPNEAMEKQLSDILADAQKHQEDEKRNMIELISFRAGILSELLAQMNSFDAYFQGALAFSRATHPCTNYLFQGAMRAAEFACMYYKNLYQRARPSQLWPELMPAIQVPGHASFPSAHATQAYTIARVLQKVVVEDVVPSVLDVTTRLAQRIARGREVLGVHYPSDSEAGRILAAEVAEAFMDCPTVDRLVSAAQEEWRAFAV